MGDQVNPKETWVQPACRIQQEQKNLKVSCGLDDISITGRKPAIKEATHNGNHIVRPGSKRRWEWYRLAKVCWISSLRWKKRSLIHSIPKRQLATPNWATWKSFASTLSSLQTASYALKSASGFELTTASLSSSSSTAAASLLSATTDSTAAKGSYQIVVTNKAQVEKLASNSFSSKSTALGKTGTILINGWAVQIDSSDTLQSLSAKINNLNSGTSATGVTASIMQDTASTYRLVLTSSTEGAAGISLLNGSASDTTFRTGVQRGRYRAKE